MLTPDLASLSFYVGRWSCSGTEYDADGAVTQRYANLEVRVAPAYNRRMTVDVYDNGAHVTSELKGIDPTGHYHHLWTANGGSYGSLATPGWDGNPLVFDEDHPGEAEKTRMTFTKVGATHFTHRADEGTGTGFHRGFEKACHKV